MEVTARAATDDDLAALAQLADEAIAELSPHRGGEVWRRQQARTAPVSLSLAEDVRAPSTQVVVGTIDETVVGYGVVRIEDLTDGGRLGVISDFFTVEGARGVSVGEEMMNLMLDWCREQGCFGVDSIALPGDRHTKNFFESFGLVARAIVVHRSLEP